MDLTHCSDSWLVVNVNKYSTQDIYTGEIYSNARVIATFCKKHMASWKFREYDDAEQFATSLIQEPLLWLLMKYPVKTA